jgi:hypothetical protein|nr:hypothetical protein [Paraburkholderia sp. Ac-20347]
MRGLTGPGPSVLEIVVRRSKFILGAAVAAIACVSGAANAARVGVFIGGGVPYYYPVAPMPYYWGPPPVIVTPPPPPPPDYVEQGQAGDPDAVYQQGPANGPNGVAASQNSDTWYYCDASKTYYPYVKQCASGWRSVPAQAAPSN